MKTGFKILAYAVACLSLAPLSQPAFAANRAFTPLAAVYDDPASAPCFSHRFGNWSLNNTCSASQNVFLPMSVDNAAWYTV